MSKKARNNPLRIRGLLPVLFEGAQYLRLDPIPDGLGVGLTVKHLEQNCPVGRLREVNRLILADRRSRTRSEYSLRLTLDLGVLRRQLRRNITEPSNEGHGHLRVCEQLVD